MKNALNYYWRLGATGVGFAAFGLGGLALSTLAFPALFLMPQKNRAMRVRWIIHKSFSLFIWIMKSLRVLSLEVVGAEKLRHCPNTLVLASHPTLIDVVVLLSMMKGANCVVKRDLWSNPFLGSIVRAAEYISNSEAEHLINSCAKALDTGNPLIIFPEGTRTPARKPLHFLRGAAHIAIKSGAPILPVLIHCTPSTLGKGNRWHQIPCRRFHMRIEVLAPISANQWISPKERQSVAVRKLTRSLEDYFGQELGTNGRNANTQA